MSKKSTNRRRKANKNARNKTNFVFLDIGKSLNKAVKLHRHGNTLDALRICRKILKQEPDNFDALQLLGAIELSRGHNEQAIELISHALTMRPDLPALHCNLGIGLMRLHQHLNATEAFQKALGIDRQFLLAHFYLGKVFLKARLPGEALPHLQTANQLRSADAETVVMLAEALCLERGLDAALALVQTSVFSSGELAQIYLKLGQTLRDAQQWEMSLTVLQKSYQLNQHNKETIVNLAVLLERMNKLEEAWEFVKPHLHQSAQPNMVVNIIAARLKRRQGKLDEARQLAQKALLDADDSDTSAAMYHEFGTILDKQKNYSAAWEAFTTSNQLMQKQADDLAISNTNVPDLITRCNKWCQSDRLSTPTAKDTLEINPPIVFFCGFPRSGTTLMEQILSRHPQIIITNETPALGEAASMMGALLGIKANYPEDIAQLNPEQLSQLRGIYLQRLGFDKQEKTTLLVDKMPLNTWFLPLALRLFPQAKVLFALRNPLDTCLSCFIQDFELNESMIHFLGIHSTVQLYQSTMQLWEQYKTILQPDYLEYRYEDLVTDPATIISKITTFLGVDLVENLSDINPEDATRVVLTPSYEAVTSPIHTSAVSRWRQYEKQLQPVHAELMQALSQYGYDVLT